MNEPEYLPADLTEEQRKILADITVRLSRGSWIDFHAAVTYDDLEDSYTKFLDQFGYEPRYGVASPHVVARIRAQFQTQRQRVNSITVSGIRFNNATIVVSRAAPPGRLTWQLAPPNADVD